MHKDYLEERFDDAFFENKAREAFLQEKAQILLKQTQEEDQNLTKKYIQHANNQGKSENSQDDQPKYMNPESNMKP